MPSHHLAPPSPLRLNCLRAGYLLLVLGLGAVIWPELLAPPADWSLSRSIVAAMLGALSALSLLGLYAPMRMLPLLLFELAWKSIWLLRAALPAWHAHALTPGITETAIECALALVFLPLIPWRHLLHSLRAPEPFRILAAPGSIAV